ncbi:MAG: hypothetical protein KGL39_57210 [Patescibacteria group bacterium]|nr:hypothetical protein [Patescibacteria group bacterium]
MICWTDDPQLFQTDCRARHDRIPERGDLLAARADRAQPGNVVRRSAWRARAYFATTMLDAYRELWTMVSCWSAVRIKYSANAVADMRGSIRSRIDG